MKLCTHRLLQMQVLPFLVGAHVFTFIAAITAARHADTDCDQNRNYLLRVIFEIVLRAWGHESQYKILCLNYLHVALFSQDLMNVAMNLLLAWKASNLLSEWPTRLSPISCLCTFGISTKYVELRIINSYLINVYCRILYMQVFSIV
jgi:hypothetical protein